MILTLREQFSAYKRMRNPIPKFVQHIAYSNSLYIGKDKAGKKVYRKAVGKDRTGIRCESLHEAVNGSLAALQVEKPRFMIDTIAWECGSKLTAKDHALYELLYAHARKEGVDKVYHEIDLKLVQKFIGVLSVDRLEEALVRILGVRVKYDIKKKAKRFRRLLGDAYVVGGGGSKFIRFSIPEATRNDILESGEYTWLDLKAFKGFKNKYSARLYQKLSLIAGRDCYFRRPWNITLQNLAEFVGYAEEGETFHSATFDRAINKAIDELKDSDLDFSFSVSRPKRAKKGKGRPLGKYTFAMSKKQRSSLYTQKAAKLDGLTLNNLFDRRYCSLADHEYPERLWIAQAVKYLKEDAITISKTWRDNIAAAHKDADIIIGSFRGGELLDLIKSEGLKIAFEKWVNAGFVNEKTIRARDMLREDYDLHAPFVPDYSKQPKKEEIEAKPAFSIAEEPPAAFDEMEELYIEQLVDEYEAQGNSKKVLELADCDEDIPF